MKSDPAVQYAIGIDLGGTKIELGIVDHLGRIYHSQRLDTPVQEGPQAIEKQVIAAICTLQGKTEGSIIGVGIGAAGQIHPETGEVIFAPNLGWHHVPLQSHLEKALSIPVRVMNDVRAITWGEWLYGAGQGYQDLLCVFVGTGIGGGVVSNGRLLTGCSHTFGEVGHMTIALDGVPCTCGKPGCLEVYAAGWGIAARAKEALAKELDKQENQVFLELTDHSLNVLTAKEVVRAYRLGNLLAKRIIEQAQKALTMGMASMVNLFNPCRLIIGGGLLDGLPEFVTAIREGIHQFALKSATEHLDIVPAKLGKEAGVIGSAAAIFKLLS